MGITTYVGAKIHRREDPRLVTGQGRFVDDHTRTRAAHSAVVRSPYPHANIKSIDLTRARSAPGVLAVYTQADIAPVIAGVMPVAPAFVAEKKTVPDHYP